MRLRRGVALSIASLIVAACGSSGSSSLFGSDTGGYAGASGFGAGAEGGDLGAGATSGSGGAGGGASPSSGGASPSSGGAPSPGGEGGTGPSSGGAFDAGHASGGGAGNRDAGSMASGGGATAGGGGGIGPSTGGAVGSGGSLDAGHGDGSAGRGGSNTATRDASTDRGGFGGSENEAGTGGALSSGGQSSLPAGEVACGTAACVATSLQHCCYGPTPSPHCYGGTLGGSCFCNAGACTAINAECDGPEDCLSNQVCCAEMQANQTVYTHLHCLLRCASDKIVKRAEVCHSGSNTCPSSTSCTSDPLLPAAYGACD